MEDSMFEKTFRLTHCEGSLPGASLHFAECYTKADTGEILVNTFFHTNEEECLLTCTAGRLREIATYLTHVANIVEGEAK
jgi:hypothetical protein